MVNNMNRCYRCNDAQFGCIDRYIATFVSRYSNIFNGTVKCKLAVFYRWTDFFPELELL